MKEFDFYEPSTIKEACNLLATTNNSMLIAGGTDLIVQMKREKKHPSTVINLKHIQELEGISVCDEGVCIGALTKIADIAASPDIYNIWRSVSIGADNIGTPQVRNLATIGGNVCNSSPCADTVPGLIVSNAVAIIAGIDGERKVQLEDFFDGPGRNCLGKGELLKSIWLPKIPINIKQAFCKMGPRKAADIAVVNLAISLSLENGVCTYARIAAGSVAPTPIRITEAEKALKGVDMPSCDLEAIADLVAAKATPIDDVRGSAEYRLHILKAMSVRLLHELWS